MAFVEIPWARYGVASTNPAVTSATPPFNVWATASNEYLSAYTDAPVPAGEVTLEVRYSKPTDGTEYAFGLGLDAPFEWIYPPSDLDGGGFYEGWRVAWPPVGVTVWRPKWVVPVGGRPLVLDGRPRPFGTRAATDFSVSGPMTLMPVDGVLRRWEAETYGSTTIYPPKHVLSGINGPWVSATGDAAGKALAVRLNLDGPGRVSVPFYSSGGPLTVHPSSFGGSVALVDAGGAVDNGDGTITIPPSTRCLPMWDAPAGNFAVEMAKTATANYTVSYGPAYVVFAPTLTGINPTSGTAAGGTYVILTGTNLAGTIGVDFGGTPATLITAITDTALLVTTPAHPAGTVDVTATDGTTTTDPLAYEYTEATGPPTDGPDVIANLVALLTSELGVPVSSRRSPTATKDSDPSVVVRRTGGPSKGVASDNPTVTIEAWAPTTTESFQLLQSARMVVIEAAEQGRAGLRRYDEFAGPADLPDPSTTNPRHTLTASVVTRLE